MFDRTLSLLVALCLALLVWLYARSRDVEILDNEPVPVTVQLAAGQADNYALEVNGSTQVPVSFTGPPVRVRELRGMLQRGEVHVTLTVTVPEERQQEPRYSETLRVEAADIHAPTGVKPLVVEGRNRIPVTVYKLVERRLPVHFVHAQEFPTGPIILEPATVLVRGPQETLDKVRVIPTEPSVLPMRSPIAPPTALATGKAVLQQKIDGKAVTVTPDKVTVKVPAQARKVYEIPDVPIQFLCPPEFKLRPKFFDDRGGKVTVKVSGPVQEQPPKVTAYIDLTSRDGFSSGLNHEPLQIQLPREFQLEDEETRGKKVPFDLQPADFLPR